MRKHATSALLIVLLITLGCEKSERPVTVESWVAEPGFENPESTVLDATHHAIYVSNISGNARQKDGNGFISRLTDTGRTLELKWHDGLNGPTGIDLSGQTLYVADVDELVAIDVITSNRIATYKTNAGFLNDVSADEDGNVYVSDMDKHTIYRLEADSLVPWINMDSVRSPNGVLLELDRVLIASGDSDDANPGDARSLRAANLAGSSVTPIEPADGIGALDAIESDGRGGYFLSDWASGHVLHFKPGVGADTLLRLGQGTADLDFDIDTDMLYVPLMLKGQLAAYQVRWVEE